MFNIVHIPAVFGIALGILFKVLGGPWLALVILSVMGILVSVVVSIILGGMTM